MTQRKKYSSLTLQEKNSWRANILRRASAKKTIVSKTLGGFKTEAEATAWAENELSLFTTIQNERNKRQSQKRAE